MNHIKIVDGNSLLFRSFYAMYRPGVPLMSNKDGIPTNAIFIFHKFMKKLKDDLNEGDRLIVCFDTGKKTFRSKLLDQYKQQRKPIEPELKVQIPISREMLDAMNISHCELEGYEADDLAGSLAKYAEKLGDKVDLYTSDKDYFQLISPNISVNFLRKGLSEVQCYTMDNFHELFGINPCQITDYKGLVGDSSDNFKGIPGIGEKTAIKLLNTYNDLDEIIQAMKSQKTKTALNIVEHEEDGQFCKKLAEIVLNLPVEEYYNSSMVKDYDNDALLSFYSKYSFNSFANELKKKMEVHLFDIERVDSLTQDAEKEKIIEISSLKEVLNPEVFVFDYDQKNYHRANIKNLFVGSSDKKIYTLPADKIKDDLYLKEFFENSSNTYSAYDNKALIVILSRYQIDVKAKVEFDLLLATYLIDTNVEDSPSAVLDSYDYSYGDNLNIYCTICSAILNLKNSIIKKLEVLDELKLYKEVELPLSSVLASMEIEGVPLNVEAIDNYGKSIHRKMDAIKEEIMSYSNEEINLNSPRQVGHFLYEVLNIPKPDKKGSTANDMLLKIVDEHPVVSLLINYRKYAKLTSSYTDTLPSQVFSDGKIHAMFNQALTTTGRLSMSEPNLQNISIRDEEGKLIRKCFFYPDDENLFLSFDYSQIELRILAHVTGDQNLIDVFNSGEDIHASTASKIFGIPLKDVSHQQRAIAKTVNFSIVYGTTPYGLADKLKISPAEAKTIIEAFYNTFPGIRTFEEKVKKEVNEKEFIKTMLKRRRYLKDIHSSNHLLRAFSERAAINAVIQGSAADLIKVAMINTYKALLPYKTKMILQIHDELIFKVPKEEIEIIKPIIKNAMESAMNLSIPLQVEGEEGKTWYDAK